MTTEERGRADGSSRTALVTGSAGGIGSAVGDVLSSRGFKVIGVDGAAKVPDGTLQVDLGSWDACLEVVERVGPIDVLVNNAAVLIEDRPLEVSEADFERTISVNLRAPFLLTRQLIEGMKERGYGRVINITSVGARTGGSSDSSVYAATKAGLISLTKHFARLYSPFGVTTNAIAPGAIDTPMARRQGERNPEIESLILSWVPAGRWGQPREVANVVAFLASEDASFVNGVTIDVNGGWVMV